MSRGCLCAVLASLGEGEAAPSRCFQIAPLGVRACHCCPVLQYLGLETDAVRIPTTKQDMHTSRQSLTWPFGIPAMPSPAKLNGGLKRECGGATNKNARQTSQRTPTSVLQPHFSRESPLVRTCGGFHHCHAKVSWLVLSPARSRGLSLTCAPTSKRFDKRKRLRCPPCSITSFVHEVAIYWRCRRNLHTDRRRKS